MWFLQINRSRRRPLLRVIGPVADFTLTNQDGQLSTLADFTNHVWVADIIFTRCAGPCPRMTGQMRSLQNLLPPDSTAQLVTLTTDPDFDSPAVLKKYGERFNADSNRWTFLTGTKKEIAALASGSLKLSAVPVKLGRPQRRRRPVHPHDDFCGRGQTRAVARQFRDRRRRRGLDECRPAAPAQNRPAAGERTMTILDLPAVNASSTA